MSPSLDWPGLMRAGMAAARSGGLGLTPVAFWALTPAELALILGDPVVARPMGRARLDDLVRQFPDEGKEVGR